MLKTNVTATFSSLIRADVFKCQRLGAEVEPFFVVVGDMEYTPSNTDSLPGLPNTGACCGCTHGNDPMPQSHGFGAFSARVTSSVFAFVEEGT